MREAVTEERCLNLAERMLASSGVPMRVKAVAARRIKLVLGDASTQEAHQHHNHPAWAEICQYVAVSAQPMTERDPYWLTEDDWVADYPFGPGHSSFALVRVSDWLARTDRKLFNQEGQYTWFKQLASRPGCCYYERLVAALVFGDVLSYVMPEHGPLLYRLPLGLLDDAEYQVATKAAHSNTRVGCNFLGHALELKDLTVFTYLDCLRGD